MELLGGEREGGEGEEQCSRFVRPMFAAGLTRSDGHELFDIF